MSRVVPILISACLLGGYWSVPLRSMTLARIHVVFEPSAGLPSAISADGTHEAAAIWAPYAVELSDGPGDGASPSIDLQVRIDTERDAGDGDNTLGEIYFGADGLPASVVTLYLRPIDRLARETSIGGSVARFWPPGLHDLLMARIVGRALAHEVGHFVLRSPTHAATGLMRARQQPSTWVQPGRRALVLSGAEQNRLARMMGPSQPAFPITSTLR